VARANDQPVAERELLRDADKMNVIHAAAKRQLDLHCTSQPVADEAPQQQAGRDPPGGGEKQSEHQSNSQSDDRPPERPSDIVHVVQLVSPFIVGRGPTFHAALGHLDRCRTPLRLCHRPYCHRSRRHSCRRRDSRSHPAAIQFMAIERRLPALLLRHTRMAHVEKHAPRWHDCFRSPAVITYRIARTRAGTRAHVVLPFPAAHHNGAVTR
jgi:hypothetical protein